MAVLRRFIARWRRRRRRWIRGIICVYFVCLILFAVRISTRGYNLKRTINQDIHHQNVHQTATIIGNYTPVSVYDRTAAAKYFHSKSVDDAILLRMLNNNQSLCNGSFLGYSERFACLHGAVVVPSRGHGRTGGENISAVINQKEGDEYYTLDSGFFQFQCGQQVNYRFGAKDHLHQWMAATETVDSLTYEGKVMSRRTIAVVRYEYVNLYFTMIDFYNTFLLLRAFSIEPDDADILWIDGHPAGSLDATWDVLFGQVQRIGQLTEPLKFQTLYWGIQCYNSPIRNHNSPTVPYIEEFREFVLGRHGINNKAALNCANLTVLFTWRRDYVAHPRNPSGQVSRKIKNEDELLSRVRDLLPGHSVRGIQMDVLSMFEQLNLISKVDILIGMHGAGLSHTLFLPKHAGLVELYPKYSSTAKRPFRTMSAWRKLKYSLWSNTDHSRELPGRYTVVDVKAVLDLVQEMNHKLCGDRADS